MLMMTDKSKGILSSTLVASLAGIGVCYFVAKYHTRILKKIRLVLDYRNPLRHQVIEVVNNAEDCLRVVNKLKLHCAEYNVLGFDCEWVTVGGSKRPVALLQLASHRGLCALIRLCMLKRIPPELKELLEDNEIIKVGVAPADDANYLAKDYGVCVGSVLDLRFIAQLAQCRPEGLAKLSHEHLNVQLDKNWRVRCSNWEAPVLTDIQRDYAAKDAQVGVEIFKVLISKISTNYYWSSKEKHTKEVLDLCYTFLDLRFKANHNVNVSSKVGQSKTSSSKIPLNQQQNRRLTTRSKPLYHNCFLEAPDGDILCTCARKKAAWYVEKGLGQVVTEEPYTVRLIFEPAGRAVGDVGKYYRTPKINQCVVCGENNSYIRKNVIPREYRRFLPFVMKNHTSHDVLLLCPNCHQLSNLADQTIRNKLAIESDAPFAHADGANKTIELPQLKTQKSAARALYYQKEKLPPKRYEELHDKFLSFYPENTVLTDELLLTAVDMDTFELNENYSAHGAKVVEFYKNKEGGLVSLERLWREHFLKIMKPKFMPELWSVEHNVQRLEIRSDEGRIDDKDLKATGVIINKENLEIQVNGYDSDDSDSLMSQPSSNNISFDDDFSIENLPEADTSLLERQNT